MSVLDEAVRYEEEVLGDLEYQAFRWTYIFFRQIFQIWQTLRYETNDLEKSNNLFMEACWLGEDMMDNVVNLMKEKGIVVKDLKSFANLAIEHYKTFGIPLKIYEMKEDEMLIGGDYCPNPMFSVSPHDKYIDRASFAQYDGWIGTYNLFNVYVKATKMPFEVIMKRTLCLGLGCCRILIRKKKK